MRKFFLFGSLAELNLDDPSSIWRAAFLRPGDSEAAYVLIPPVVGVDRAAGR